MLSNLPKQYGYTDWMALANVSGTGVSVGNSATANLFTGTLPPHKDLSVEIEFDISAAAGTGLAFAWARLAVMSMDLVPNPDTTPANLYTARVAATTLKNRKIKINLGPVVMGSYQDVIDFIPVTVQARGQNEDTQWLISNIRVRLVYKML